MASHRDIERGVLLGSGSSRAQGVFFHGFLAFKFIPAFAIAKGKSMHEMAAETGISERTFDTHCGYRLAKFGVHFAVSLVVRGVPGSTPINHVRGSAGMTKVADRVVHEREAKVTTLLRFRTSEQLEMSPFFWVESGCLDASRIKSARFDGQSNNNHKTL